MVKLDEQVNNESFRKTLMVTEPLGWNKQCEKLRTNYMWMLLKKWVFKQPPWKNTSNNVENSRKVVRNGKKRGNCIAQVLSAAVACLHNECWQFYHELASTW